VWLEMGQDIEKNFMGQFDAFQGVEMKGNGPMACEKKQGKRARLMELMHAEMHKVNKMQH
jgi:hypothetical protein